MRLADIVGRYHDGTYRPSGNAARDQRAVFIARGLATGHAHVQVPTSITKPCALQKLYPGAVIGGADPWQHKLRALGRVDAHPADAC